MARRGDPDAILMLRNRGVCRRNNPRARQDLNLRPLAPEASALSPELRARTGGRVGLARREHSRSATLGREMEFSVMFAGTAGSVPSARRGLPALPRPPGAERILIDCGEGTQRQLLRSVGLSDLTDVFITHLHVDHWLGLPGLLQTFNLRDRERPLAIHGPEGLAELMRSMRASTAARLRARGGRARGGGVGAARHARDRRGERAPPRARLRLRPREDARPGRFDAELAASLGVAPGPDFGRLQRGETVAGVAPEQVIGAEREGRKVVVSGDTAPCETLAIAAHGADLLVHEATFGEDGARPGALTGHSTAAQAAAIAATPRSRCSR
jgi:ribonuclease Z